jgi:hypothetical protein
MYNKFKSTKIYGTLEVIDYDMSASAVFQRNVTIGGSLLYYDASSNLQTLDNSKLGKLQQSLATTGYVDTAIASIDTSSYLTKSDASLNYLKITDASNNYAKISYVDSRITDVSNNHLSLVDASNNYLKITDAASQYALTSYVDTRFTNLINNAPAVYDTLGEIATQLATDASAVNVITTQLTYKGDLSGNNAWIGTNTFNSYIPTTTLSVTNANQFATKSYVDTADALLAPKSAPEFGSSIRVQSGINAEYLDIKAGYNYLTSSNDANYISYIGASAPYDTHVFAGNVFVGNSLGSTNGFLNIGNGNDLSRVSRNLNVDNVLRCGFNDSTDVGASFSNGATIDVSGNINVLGGYTIGGTNINSLYVGLASNNTISGDNTFSGTSNTFNNTIYANTINTNSGTTNNELYSGTTSGSTTICGNGTLSGLISIGGLSSGQINIGNLSTGTINIGAGSTATAKVNIGRSAGQNEVVIGAFDFSGNYLSLPASCVLSGKKTMDDLTQLSKVGETLYEGTVTSNAISVNWNTVSGGLISISPSSNNNIALTITNINPISASSFSCNLCFLINVGTYKKCIAGNVTIGGVGYTPISSNGYSSISVSASATFVLQTISVVYINSTTPSLIVSNVASLY